MLVTNSATAMTSAVPVELVPNERVRHGDRFDGAGLLGKMRTTITLTQVCGTELKFVQEGIPDVIAGEQRCLGWQESLFLLALLVEADIPG